MSEKCECEYDEDGLLWECYTCWLKEDECSCKEDHINPNCRWCF